MPQTFRIKIPKLGWATTEAELCEWLVLDGSEVKVGTPIFILETDKVQNEIEAPLTGTLRHVGEAGTTYPVGEVIAEITAH